MLAAVDHGPVPADMKFDLVVGVKLRDADRLPLLHQQLADRDDALTPEEFGDRMGASRADYARFVAFLAGRGFEITRINPGRTTVSVRGTADVINQVFGVTMHQYEDRYGSFTATPTPVSVQNEIFHDVSGVVGIDNSQYWFSHMVKPSPVPEPQATVAAQSAAELQARYSEDTTTLMTAGQGQTIAVLSTNSPTLVSDVAKYLSQQHKVLHPALDPDQYKQVFVGGPNRDAASSLAYGENALDAELVLAMAPFAKVVQVFTATNGPGLFTDGISYIVNQLPQAHTVTVSWGTCERGAAGEMPVMNALFAQAKAQGQQWFFASGDSGADGCRDGSGNKIISADWPASSPYVVGVGGTTSTSASEDMAWDLGGGAPSESFAKPAFQVGAMATDDGARDVPDVSAIAGGGGATYYDHGIGQGVLGTSVASPVFAGAWAVLNQKKGGTKGITTGLESIYALGKAKKGFNDVTIGGNADSTGLGSSGYQTAAGYDLATGWGTPNLTSLIANWQ